MLYKVLFLMSVVLACSPQPQAPADHPDLETMYRKDIEIRELDARTDTVVLERYDRVHREAVFRLLAENRVQTVNDKIRAAWILQHTAAQFCDGQLTSLSPENFLLAYQLSSSALRQLEAAGDTAALRKLQVPRIVALNYDRYLLYTAGYQKFGTQFVFDEATGSMLLAPVDTTLATDADRLRHQVEPLDSLRAKHTMKAMPSR